MAGGKIKHVFPGGSTPLGFFSYHAYAISIDSTRIFLLKGGSATGKSNFMKIIGQAMLEQGYAVEYHHCSSNPDYLDGLVIPRLNAALIDHSSPYTIAFEHAGCVDEILAFGEYRPESTTVKTKAEVLAYTKGISQHLQRACRMLTAAKAIYDDWEAANNEAMDYSLANQTAANLLEGLYGGISTAGHGKNRKLFASAITPAGPLNYIESIASGLSSRYIITGLPGTGKATLLSKVAAAAVDRGMDIESYYCPLDPLKVEHVIIPALDTALTTSVPPHNQSARGAIAIIDMNDCLDKDIVTRLEIVTDYDRTAFWEFFGKAGTYINEAKKLHDELEAYYTANSSCIGVDELIDTTLAKLFALVTQ